MLTPQQISTLRDMALAEISISLNAPADRVEIARRAVISTLQLVAPLVQMMPPPRKPPERPRR